MGQISSGKKGVQTFPFAQNAVEKITLKGFAEHSLTKSGHRTTRLTIAAF